MKSYSPQKSEVVPFLAGKHDSLANLFLKLTGNKGHYHGKHFTKVKSSNIQSDPKTIPHFLVQGHFFHEPI